MHRDTNSRAPQPISIYIGLAVFVVCWLASSGAHAFKPEIGEQPAPLEQLELVTGQPVNLADYAGKPLILYFGADWCAPCVANGRPAVLDAYSKYRSRGLQVLFIDLDDSFKFRGKKLQESRALGIPIAMRALPAAGATRLSNFDFGTFGRIQVVPTAILVDASGKVVGKIEQGTRLRGELDGAVSAMIR